MKMKGIPIWEQYLEFIVLGVAVIVFATLVAMQFIGNPNAVEDRTIGLIGPGDVDALLQKEADRLRPIFENNAPPQRVLEQPEPVLPEFERRLVAAVSPSDTLTIPQFPTAVGTIGTVVVTDVAFVDPQIASPYDVIAQQYFDALPNDVVDMHDGLKQLLAQQPYDVSWITTAASFDVSQALDEFRNGGIDGVPAPVPTSWFDGRITIVDVIIEREEKINGGWTDTQVVSTLPGQFTLRPQLHETDLGPADRDDMQQQLAVAGLMAEIMQPEFYDTRNASWFPPTQPQVQELTPDMTDDQRQILQTQSDLNRLRNELARVEQLLADAGGELYADDDNRPRGGGTSGAGGGSAGGGGQRAPGGGMAGGSQKGRRNPGGEAAQDRNDSRRRTLTQKRDRLADDASQLEQRLTNLGADAAAIEDVQADFDPFSQDTVRIWAHDLDVKPGATYRYRFTVHVLNPYFKRDVHLLEDQKHLAISIVIASQASDWSKPIVAKPPLETFVVNANAPTSNGGQGKLRLGQTSVEVFRFYDGRWWKERYTVEPGERIGDRTLVRNTGEAGDVTIDFGTDWYVLDIVSDLSADPATDRGRAASVLMQSISYPDVLTWRHPNTDIDAIRRRELEERVRLAELGEGAQVSAQ